MSERMRKAAIIGSAIIAIVLLLLLTGYVYERVAESRDRERFPPPGKLIDIGGRRLHIVCRGTGSPTVVVETGAGQSSAQWKTIQDSISLSTRICVYDRSGFGWSDPAPAGRSISDRANELGVLLAKAKVEPPYIIVAHSYGGVVARKFVRDNIKTVRGIVFVDAADEGFAYSPEFKEVSSNARKQILGIKLLTQFGIARAVLATKSEADVAKQLRVPRELIEQNGLTVAGVSPGFFQEYSDELASYDLTPISEQHPGVPGSFDDLPIIAIRRGLPIEGSGLAMEKSWADAQNRLAKLSSHSELIVASHSRHDIYYDEPNIVIDAIQRMLRDTNLSMK